MATAVSKPSTITAASSVSRAATKPMPQALENTARKLCNNICVNERKAWLSSTPERHHKNFTDANFKNAPHFPTQLKQFDAYKSNVWVKLATERLAFASAYTDKSKNVNYPEVLASLPTSFKKGDLQGIRAGVLTAYSAVMLNKDKEGIKRCVDAATRALSSLPKDNEEVTDLTARICVIDYLNRHREGKASEKAASEEGPVVHAPGFTYKASQTVSRVLSSRIGIVATAVVANSVLNALGIMPAWTRFGTIQGMYGIGTAIISWVINSIGANDAAALALKAQELALGQAQGFANTASAAALNAASATTVEAAQNFAHQAAYAAQEAAKLAATTPQAQALANAAALSSQAAASSLAKVIEANSGYSTLTIAAATGLSLVGLNSLAHAVTDKMPNWSKHLTLQGMFALVTGLCIKGETRPARPPTPDSSPDHSPHTSPKIKAGQPEEELPPVLDLNAHHALGDE